MTETVNPRGFATQFQYDALDRQTVTIDADSKRTTTAFDAVGNVTQVTDARGNSTQYQYDVLNRLTVTVDAAAGRTTVLFDKVGNTTAVTDARGNQTQYQYDALNRRTVVIDAFGGRTTTAYDAVGNVTQVTDARGNNTQFVYDALNRRSVTIDPRGNRTTALFDKVGNTTGVRDAANNLASFVYDGVNRRTAAVDALGNRTTTLYDKAGNVTSMTDPLNHTTQYQYDALNRQTIVIDARNYRTTTLFDAAGNVTYVKDAANNVTTFAYDGLDRKTRQTDALGEAATFAYDPVGLLTSATDRLGRRRDFAYDSLGRLTTQVWYSAGGTAAETLTYSFDAVGNQLTAKNAAGTYTMVYDALNRVTVAKGPNGNTLTMSYDAVGNRTVVVDSAGGTTTSTYDAANNLTRRDFGGAGMTPLRTDFTYDALNRAETQTRYANLAGTLTVGSTTFLYDAAGRMTGLIHRNGAGTSLANYTYTYDAASRLTTEVLNGTTKTYTYDDADQLTADGTSTHTYDGTGNRTEGSHSTGTGNRLSTDGTWNYTYDDEGNQTKKVRISDGLTWTYGYDHRNQMTWAERRATDGGTLQLRAEYTYEAYGNRAQKSVDTDGSGAVDSTERYDYDGWKPGGGFFGNENWDIWRDQNGTRYLRGDVIDQVFARLASDGAGAASWLLTDRQGSVRDVTDASGAVASHLDYDGYGNVISESAPSLSGRYGWQGRERDTETGFSYHHARYYDPSSARWTSEDPVGFDAGDSNLYRYVGNQPTNRTDPSGLSWVDIRTLRDGTKQVLYYSSWRPNDPEVLGILLDNGDVQRGNYRLSYHVVQHRLSGPWGFTPADWDVWFRDQHVSSYRDGPAAARLDGPAPPRPAKFEPPHRVPRPVEESPVPPARPWKPEPPRLGGDAPVTLPPDPFAKHDGILQKLQNDLLRKRVVVIDEVKGGGYTVQVMEVEPIQGSSVKEIGALVDAMKAAAREGILQQRDTIGPPPLLPEEQIQQEHQQRIREGYRLPPTVGPFSPEEAAESRRAEQRREWMMQLGELGGPFWFINTVGGAFAGGIYVRGRRPGPPRLNTARLGAPAIVAVGRAPAADLLPRGDFISRAKLEGGSTRGTPPLAFYRMRPAPPGSGGAVALEGRRFGTLQEATAAARLALSVRTGHRINVVGDACFVAGTPLLTPQGERPIEALRPGDLVLSRDEHDPEGAVAPRAVEEVFVRVGPLLDVRAGGRLIRATPEHPFFVRGRGWRCAKELAAGYELCSHDGRAVRVESVADGGEVGTVYNVRVADFHTYFVGGGAGGTSVWAHNAEYVVVYRDGLFRLALENGRPLPPHAANLSGRNPAELAQQLGQSARVTPESGNIASQLGALRERELNAILARIQRGDHRGRPFGTPRNRRMPTLEEFNPRLREVRAGDLEATIRSRMHPENPQQAGPVRQLSNDELVRLRLEDPISGVDAQGGISLTGGHHRTAEIIRRVQSGQMSPDTIIRVVVHD